MAAEPHRPRHRASLTIAAIIGVALLALGCTEPDAHQRNEMTPREGRDAIVEFARSSTEQLDLTGWWPDSGAPWAQGCALGGGETGASYGFDLWAKRGTGKGVDVEQRVNDVHLIAAYWESLGMTARIVGLDGAAPAVFGHGGPVLRASFDTDAPDDYYHVGATARCSPGDAYTLNVEDDAQRDQGIILPGDEGTILWEDRTDVPGNPGYIPPTPTATAPNPTDPESAAPEPTGSAAAPPA